MPDEVRAEIGPYFIDRGAVIDEDSRKLPKLDHETAHYVRKSLTVSLRTLISAFPDHSILSISWFSAHFLSFLL